MWKIPSTLLEELAAIEHKRWASWQRYLHSKCELVTLANGETMWAIPNSSWDHWERQIATEYADLTEREKESDRAEVVKYWPTVHSFAFGWMLAKLGSSPPWEVAKSWLDSFGEEP